ncbi:hypothetical protein BDB01DRAFT_836891 [Pilobolus umbonatus]|nr:hypothetical protein BDB01DRAFT_836891 [Pilobolus umbonatus]
MTDTAKESAYTWNIGEFLWKSTGLYPLVDSVEAYNHMKVAGIMYSCKYRQYDEGPFLYQHLVLASLISDTYCSYKRYVLAVKEEMGVTSNLSVYDNTLLGIVSYTPTTKSKWAWALIFAEGIKKTFTVLTTEVVLDVADGKDELAMFLSHEFGMPVIEPNNRKLTRPTVEIAIQVNKAFAVVPYCVFSHGNRDRLLNSGNLVTCTEDLVKYM